jgi:tetratricopeptide (TPR) repeat protein
MRAMKLLRLIVNLLGVLSIFGFGGCSKDDSVDPQPRPEVFTADDHDRIYEEGCKFISPYMQLHGVDVKPANTEKAREELDRGVILLQKVVEMNSDNWAAYWVMGKGFQALKQSENACDAFGKAFAIKNDNPDVAREYMLECMNLGRASEAIDAAKHGVSLNPNDAGLIANLAIAYLVGGRIDDSIIAIEKSLKLAPNDEISQNVKTIILEVRDGKRPQPKSAREL